jgi:FAD/FMN-containing dehydrogenase
VTLARLHAHVARTGWAFGVDFGARDSCTVGGMVATNAGGMRVVRHGSMRAQVLGVEAVLGDATVVRSLDGLVKDNTGYHLAGLLCGSEGTLGVVTAARLRLVPEPPDRVVVLAALPAVEVAVELAARLRSTVDGLDALEVILAGGLGLVCDELDLPRPFPAEPPVALLAEWAGAGDPPPSFLDAFDGVDTVAATDQPGRLRLWRYREDMALAIARVGLPHKLDVTLPLGRLAAFCDAVAGSVPSGGRLHLFGHLGDGNLHVNVTGVDPDDEALDEAVLRLVVSLGGSISAEHGIGRAKARWLHLQRSSEELAAMRAVKQALDPHGILNPGALLG